MSGYTEVEVTVPWSGQPVVVGGYYMPEERGSRESGIQMEPDLPAYFEVELMRFSDSTEDIAIHLSPETYDDIVELAMKQKTCY